MTNFFSSLKTTERVNSEDFEDVEKVCEICSGFQDSRNSFFVQKNSSTEIGNFRGGNRGRRVTERY